MTASAEAVRQDERYLVDLRVDCSPRDASVTNHATNLSRGGLFISSEKPLPLDSLLELTLTLPGPSPEASGEIQALGRVVWSCQIREAAPSLTGMGVRFLSMSHQNWKRLIEFLAGLPEPAVTSPAMRPRAAAVPSLH